MRSGYRPSRGRAPEIDEEVTGRELDKSVQRELRVLEPDNAEVVSRHLVMTSLYLDVDPDFALEHAQAAVARAGRVAAVREAAGVAAYAAEDWETALRELRTHRRMTGSHEHLPLIVDAQRALGRTAKALEEARDDEALEGLTAEQKAELAMVVSGIHRDAGDLEAARRALEIPELNPRRAFSYSPRLYSAYAEVLEALDRGAEAARWSRLAAVAEAALGQGQFAEPEIYDIDVLPDEQPEEEEGIEMAEQEPTPEEMEEAADQRRRAEAETGDDERLAAVAEDRTGFGGALEDVEPDAERTGEEELRTELGDVVEKTDLEDEDPGDPEATDETEIEGDVVTEDVADDDAATTGGMPPELREVEEDIARDNAGDAGRA